ncbi:MAG: hypothetical protein MUF49_26780 [Oculatellaceae cyanobacterium Prado106]|jgi:hypothetical protein|nr:hypothetical protein [Oculatellaceae cyanobacterium Prado106]
MRRFKYLPWQPLLIVAALTVSAVTVVDLALIYWAMRSPIANAVLAPFGSPLGVVLSVAIAAGVGTFAVYLLETLFPKLAINIGVLWTLILCLMIFLVIQSFLPFSTILVGANEISLIGIILGVFLLGGKRYWR